MSRLTRLLTNVGVILVVTALLTVYAVVNWVGSSFFQDRYEIVVPLAETGGLFENQEVTVLGHGVGTVKNNRLTDTGVQVVLDIRGDAAVPASAIVQVKRRSAVGEQALNFIPVTPDWQPPSEARGAIETSEIEVAEGWTAAKRGAVVEPVVATYPTEIQPLLDKATDLFEAIEAEHLGTVVNELGDAVGGRGELLVELNRSSLDLNETLVEGIPEFRRLIATSEPVLAILNEHRQELAGLFPPLADLSDKLAEERPTLERLLTTGRTALTQGAAFVRNTRANQHCLFNDFLDVNSMMSEPANLDNLAKLLEWHEYFYQDGFDVITQFDPYRKNVAWQRINLLIFEEARGQAYQPHRPTPATQPGAACTSPWGVGVNAVRQPDHQPPDETAPPIDFAPLVEGGQQSAAVTGGGQTGTFAEGRDGTTPATGGGLALLAGPLAFGAAWTIRRRRR